MESDENKGHFCYGCNKFFHDSNPYVTSHKGCKGKKSLGICVDGKEFGKYYLGNLLEMDRAELRKIIINGLTHIDALISSQEELKKREGVLTESGISYLEGLKSARNIIFPGHVPLKK